MSRNQLNPRRRAIERRKANPVATLIREVSTPERLAASIDADRIPVKVAYDRLIRPEWGEKGQDALNLSREISDMRSRPELLGNSDKEFLRWLEAHAMRGRNDVYLSAVNRKRLASIAIRYTNPGYAAAWRKRQADLKAASEPI